MAKTPDNSDRFINRELSWLEFNQRVLDEGLSSTNPLAERMKFLAIVSSNLDEFFMIRVAGLMQQKKAGSRSKDRAGMTPSQQLDAISVRAKKMVQDQSDAIESALNDAQKAGLTILPPSDWSYEQQDFVYSYFRDSVLPILTPLAFEDFSEEGLAPTIPGLQLVVAVELTGMKKASVAKQASLERKLIAEGKTLEEIYNPNAKPAEDGASSTSHIDVVPIPKLLPRFLKLPSGKDVQEFALIDDIIQVNIGSLFPGCNVNSSAVFRITRDADIRVCDNPLGTDFDEIVDLTVSIEEAVVERRSRNAVRLEISSTAPANIRSWLAKTLNVQDEFVFDVDGLLDAKSLFTLSGMSVFDNYRDPDWEPQIPRDLLDASENQDMWETIRHKDILLSLPYEKFDPVVQFLERAAQDPDVLAIKQTLYRTSGKSPIVKALETAALNGKEVTVLVELRARFDESQNVQWARRLENAGCNVIYGIVGLKTHAKALLVVRRENGRIRQYAHLATGNYNDKTAKIYSDLGILTADPGIVSDLAAFFNILSGDSETVGWKHLTVEPHLLRQRILDLIQQEIDQSSHAQPGHIMLKCNSLEHPDIIEALYNASQKGVKIDINVRGICCLKPGVKKLSENIRVSSIVGRYLEHARIYYFKNGGHPEVFLSSADLMVRNLETRMETIFPVLDDKIRMRLIEMLKLYFSDNQKRHTLDKNGVWKRVNPTGEPVCAQEILHNQAVQAVESVMLKPGKYIPIKGK